MGGRKTGRKTMENDDVEDLLREAQDDVLLRLSIDSHMSRGSAANFIDRDLDRRFQALKSRPAGSVKPKSSTTAPKSPAADFPIDDVKQERGDGCSNVAAVDDLLARFAAFKGSLPESSFSFSSMDTDKLQSQLKGGDGEDEIEDEKDEVEKLIKWATDAARLDPSPPSDTDDDSNTMDDRSDYSEDDHNRREAVGKKGKKK